MISNEEIITNAKNRWKCNTQSESLVCEIKDLLTEIEVYRDGIKTIRLLLDNIVHTLRMKGGE